MHSFKHVIEYMWTRKDVFKQIHEYKKKTSFKGQATSRLPARFARKSARLLSPLSRDFGTRRARLVGHPRLEYKSVIKKEIEWHSKYSLRVYSLQPNIFVLHKCFWFGQVFVDVIYCKCFFFPCSCFVFKPLCFTLTYTKLK